MKEKNINTSAFDDLVIKTPPNIPEENLLNCDELNNKIEEKYAYLIICGNDDNEYYSFWTPKIQDGFLIVNKPFQKGIVREQVLNEEIEEYFVLPLSIDEQSFDITQGILLKKHYCNSLNWLENTKEQAQNFIKDKLLLKYQQMVPTLINNMKNLEAKVKQVQEVKAIRKNSSNNLLDL